MDIDLVRGLISRYFFPINVVAAFRQCLAGLIPLLGHQTTAEADVDVENQLISRAFVSYEGKVRKELRNCIRQSIVCRRHYHSRPSFTWSASFIHHTYTSIHRLHNHKAMMMT